MSAPRPGPPPAGERGSLETPRGRLSAWETLAELFAGHRSPRYAALARTIAGDRAMEEVGPPLIVLAAVRLAALEGRATDPWGGDAAAFRSDVAALGDEIAGRVRRGLVQFTEPLRVADILPGLFLAARRYPGLPMRLVEPGTCAGFLLAPDRFEVTYPRARWRPDRAGASLTCDLDVPPGLLAGDLPIVDRVGIDLAPVDPADPASLTLLRSFAWQGDPAREQRLEGALSAVRDSPTEVLAGPAEELLPGVVGARVSGGAVTVVIDSGFSSYLTEPRAIALGVELRRLAARGPVVVITRRDPTAGPGPGSGLPCAVHVADLTRPWVLRYAATDILSERTEWVGGAW